MLMMRENLLGKAVADAGRWQDSPQHAEQSGGALRKQGLEGTAEKAWISLISRFFQTSFLKATEESPSFSEPLLSCNSY